MSNRGSNSVKNQKNESGSGVQEKLRVLCLHGYRQSGDTFKSKIGSFRKHVNKYAEFVFVTAPHKIVVSQPNDSKLQSSSADDESDSKHSKESTERLDIVDIDQRSWWSNKDDGTFKGTNKNGPAFGFDESLRIVEDAWENLGPFHGLLGFSQGACFVGLLCNLSMRGMTPIKPTFAIMAAGFRSGSLAHLNYYEETINIPSLHIYGENDAIITPDMSELLAATFEEPKVVIHPGGHFFAASAGQKNIYIDFFRDRLVEYLESKELEQADCTATIVGTATNASASDDSD